LVRQVARALRRMHWISEMPLYQAPGATGRRQDGQSGRPTKSAGMQSPWSSAQAVSAGSACSKYPECKERPLPTGQGPKDGGELIERRTRRGTFYSCANYPECDFTLRAVRSSTLPSMWRSAHAQDDSAKCTVRLNGRGPPRVNARTGNSQDSRPETIGGLPQDGPRCLLLPPRRKS
jgi:ssDNA-binding Zn-finger/Zn-ribbon topoisomerase 1